MSIFANAANPIRLFPPALIIPMFSAVFFAKINKKRVLKMDFMGIQICLILFFSKIHLKQYR